MKPAIRKAITAGSTFSVALSIGFVMQYGDALASRLGVDDPIGGPAERTQAVQPVVASAGMAFVPQADVPQGRSDSLQLAAIPQEMAVPTMDMASLSGAAPQAEPQPVAASQGDIAAITQAPIMDAPAVDTCQPAMIATAMPMAMVRLKLADSCHVSAPVTIHHQGMMFSALTDADGLLDMIVPALSRDALFIADFKTGAGAAASVMVPNLDGLDRAVLQWQGDDGVELHALEFGSGYDDAGHVWSAAAGTIAEAEAGQGGFLTSLGNTAVSDALRAEVYTYPSGQSARAGEIVLNVEAEITSRNCGRDVAAQSIQIGPDRPADAIDLTMTMPGCDAIGEFLVLKNMFADLTLAAK